MRKLHTAQEICDCKWFNRPKYFNSTADAFVKIAKTEGLPSLWSGLSPTLVLAIPATITYFTMYEQLRSWIHKSQGGTHASEVAPWVALTAGGLARVVAATIVSPLELVRTKMQSQKMPIHQVRTCIKGLVASQGVLSLWNGVYDLIGVTSPYTLKLKSLMRLILLSQDRIELSNRQAWDNPFLQYFIDHWKINFAV